jgi:hypothetical protein
VGLNGNTKNKMKFKKNKRTDDGNPRFPVMIGIHGDR